MGDTEDSIIVFMVEFIAWEMANIEFIMCVHDIDVHATLRQIRSANISSL